MAKMVDDVQADLLVLGSRSQGGLRKYVNIDGFREGGGEEEWEMRGAVKESEGGGGGEGEGEGEGLSRYGY